MPGRGKKLLTYATRKGKQYMKSPEGKKKVDAVKVKLQEQVRSKLADTPIPAVLAVATGLAHYLPTPKLVNGKNCNETGNRDVSIPGKASNDITTSASVYAFRPPRKREIEGVNYIQKTRAFGLIAPSAGEQAVADISILDAVPVYQNDGGSAKYTNLSIKKSFDDFLIASNLPVHTGGHEDVLKLEQTSIHAKTLTCELTLTNGLSTAAVVDVYELLPKHTLGPTTYSSDQYSVGYMSPAWCFNVGLSTDTPQLGNTLSYTTLGAKPSSSATWSRTWNIVKRTRVTMTGNSSHIHKSAYAINKTVPYQEYAQFSTSGGKLSGWNPSYMLVVRGLPTDTGDTKASTACSISYLADMQFNYSGHMSEGAKAIVFNDSF